MLFVIDVEWVWIVMMFGVLLCLILLIVNVFLLISGLLI